MKTKLSYLILTILMYKMAIGQMSYNFSASPGSFTPLNGGGITSALSSNTADDEISSAISLPFTFYYNCQPYTQIKVSSNGWLTFDMTITSSLLTNNLQGTSSLIVAPLWDDLQCTNNVRYKTTGAAPNRVFTVEWLNMEWNYNANTAVISFQVKLYETSNRIEFIYRQESGNVNSGSASIGLNGAVVGQFLSLNNTSSNPSVSSTVETKTISTKPATGQIYRWDPIMCSGTPSGFSISATPQTQCANFTTTLTLTGGAGGCGLTYDWQTSTNLTTWTTFSTGVTTATYNITGLRYFRLQVTCTNSGQSAYTNTVTTNVIPSPCVCGLIQIPSLPFTDNGQTTCGQGDDVTSTNVTNVCGSSYYYGGEDAVYSFTPTATGEITITINSSGSYTGLMLYEGCPLNGGTCIRSDQSSTGSKTLTCIPVTAGQVYYLVIDSWPPPTCNPYDLNISGVSSNSAPACNMNYSVSSIPFNFETFTGTPLPMTDDVLFSSVVMFGFNACFDGTIYSSGYPASNAAFVFDAVCNIPNIQSTSMAAPGVWTGYSITGPAPVFGTSIPRNAILGPWHDINPASSATIATSKIQYATFGTAPNRRTVISWEDIPYYSCNENLTPYFSGQIKIFEDGNIEIHVKNKQVCSTWNNGQAVMGLHNYDGTIYIPPVNATMHNATSSPPYNQWTMTNTAYRFTPSAECMSGCVVLPIGFKTFYGERIQKINYLYWETAEESNIKTFEVLRSTDGINFQKIGNVPPKNTPSKYQFEDITAPLGRISYYKIRSIENNGKQSETQLYAIDASMDEVFVTAIFPNPTKNEIILSIESRLIKPDGTARVQILNMFGKLLLDKEIKLLSGVNAYKIDIQNIPSGVYLVKVLVNEKEKVIEKIIKEAD